jgi:hypothetical protein
MLTPSNENGAYGIKELGYVNDLAKSVMQDLTECKPVQNVIMNWLAYNIGAAVQVVMREDIDAGSSTCSKCLKMAIEELSEDKDFLRKVVWNGPISMTNDIDPQLIDRVSFLLRQHIDRKALGHTEEVAS